MGAIFYWYPGPGAALKTVDIGRPLSNIAEREVRREHTTDSFTGTRSRVVYDAYSQVQVTIELFTDASIIRELEAIENHLKSGGTIALAEESGANFGGYLIAPPARGATTITAFSNQWGAWGTATGGAGDVLVLQSPAPEYKREKLAMASRSGLTATFSAPGVRYDYTDAPWVFVRDARFWPYLRLQAGAMNQQLIFTDRRVSWTIEMALEEVPSRIEAGSFQSYDNPWGVNEGEYGYEDQAQQPASSGASLGGGTFAGF